MLKLLVNSRIRRALDVDHEVAVIGAGFGGLGAAMALRRAGIEDIVILDKQDGVGGCWRANRYPGVAVDIPATVYSYSRAQRGDWSRLYAPGAELARYAERVADDHDLRRLLRLATTVTAATFDADGHRWTIDVDGPAGPERLTCRWLVAAYGPLERPAMPDIAGLDRFGGTVMHTARWDDGVDLAGLRVAVIGTGASAVQVVPEIAPVAGHLDVYQRTPIWVDPASTRPWKAPPEWPCRTLRPERLCGPSPRPASTWSATSCSTPGCGRRGSGPRRPSGAGCVARSRIRHWPSA